MNLTVTVKQYQDISAIKSEVKNAQNDLLQFYDLISMHLTFLEVNKTDFFEIKERFSHQCTKR